VLLVTVKDPSKVAPLKAWIFAVNWPGSSAWTRAPAPETFVPTFNVTGPLPPAAASEAQIIRSPAANPVPDQLQVGDAAHTAAARLLGPVKPTFTATPPADFAATLEPRTVTSAPSCPQLTESFEPWPP